jgi:hypothetical protein
MFVSPVGGIGTAELVEKSKPEGEKSNLVW